MAADKIMPALEGSVMPLKFMQEEYFLALARYKYAAKFAKNQTILEAGCGAGYGAFELAKAGAKIIYALDLNADSIKQCQKNYLSPRIIFKVEDLNHPEFRDQTFDLITAFEVIEHLPKYRQLIREFHRILKPGGLVIVSTPNKSVYSPNSQKPFYPFHVKEFTLAEFKNLFSAFEIKSVLGEYISGKKVMLYSWWDPRRLLRMIFANLPFYIKIAIMRCYLTVLNWVYENKILAAKKIKLSDVYFDQKAALSRVIILVAQKKRGKTP